MSSTKTHTYAVYHSTRNYRSKMSGLHAFTPRDAADQYMMVSRPRVGLAKEPKLHVERDGESWCWDIAEDGTLLGGD